MPQTSSSTISERSHSCNKNLIYTLITSKIKKKSMTLYFFKIWKVHFLQGGIFEPGLSTGISLVKWSEISPTCLLKLNWSFSLVMVSSRRTWQSNKRWRRWSEKKKHFFKIKYFFNNKIISNKADNNYYADNAILVTSKCWRCQHIVAASN